MATELTEPQRLWVEALRSGKYKQGRGKLTTVVDGQQLDCCLGVACKVAIEHGVTVQSAEKGAYGGIRVEYDDEAHATPEAVRSWFSLGDEWGSYADSRDPEHAALCLQNDNGMSFTEIADLIESRPDGLFADVSA